MHTFKVIKDSFGWTIMLGPGATSSFRTRAQAIRQANRLCDALRVHGEDAEVVVEEAGVTGVPRQRNSDCAEADETMKRRGGGGTVTGGGSRGHNRNGVVP